MTETAVEQEARDALADALAAISVLLDGDGDPRPLPSPLPGTPLARVCAAFELDQFEQGVLLLATSLELQPGTDLRCAQWNRSDQRAWLTFGLALAVLPGGRWDAFLPTAPLRAHRLVRLGPGDVLTERPVYLEERVLHALLGNDYLEPRLARRLAPVLPPHSLPAGHAAAATRLAYAWATETPHLWCEETGAGIAVAAAAAAMCGRALHHLPARLVPSDPSEVDEVVALWGREARLAPVALIVDLDETYEPQTEAAARELVARLGPFAASSGCDPRAGETILRLRVREAPFEDRMAHWRAALHGVASLARLEQIVARFRLGAHGVEAAVDTVRRGLADDPCADPHRLLWDGARAQAQPKLEDLAQRMPVRAGWSDVVLPAAPERALRALLGQARQKAVVDHAWGFTPHGMRGGGAGALFAGPSGTGKTLAAEVLAGELRLDLFRIDLSAVVSKYIGETEKNLRRVFDAAEAGGAVLLFDEADALFGKRTEVRDSHDRHANIEVSYLLQRMETYGGLAILTTNHRQHLDDAFLRRIPFIVEFPFPDERLRERIWRQIFPPGTPLEDLDYGCLARLAVAGGSVRSMARNAAFLAADRGSPVTMPILLEAAELEYEKMGRAMTPTEVRGWR